MSFDDGCETFPSVLTSLLTISFFQFVSASGQYNEEKIKNDADIW